MFKSKIKLTINIIIMIINLNSCITYSSKYNLEQFGNKGRIIFDCGDIYEGEIKNGEIHGKGIYEWEEHPEFLRFDGNFYNGLPYDGVMTTISGRRFEVNLNGKFILKGKVTEIFPNNTKKQMEL